MSKEKQIEEMAKVIEITEQIARDAHCGYPSPRMTASDLYDKGYRKQSEGKWSRFEVDSSKGYGQVYYQHKDCNLNATQLFPRPYHFCPNCGAKMKGGEE